MTREEHITEISATQPEKQKPTQPRQSRVPERSIRGENIEPTK